MALGSCIGAFCRICPPDLIKTILQVGHGQPSPIVYIIRANIYFMVFSFMTVPVFLACFRVSWSRPVGRALHGVVA